MAIWLQKLLELNLNFQWNIKNLSMMIVKSCNHIGPTREALI